MAERGIYTLANDAVLDQLIALLNSIEENAGQNIPVCIIPYDDNISRMRKEADGRANVSIYDDPAILSKWESFAADVWSSYNQGDYSFGRHSSTVHRKLCAFDGSFDKFVFMDADTLLMDRLDKVYKLLDGADFVAYDYQYKDPSHVFDVRTPKLESVISREDLQEKIFCVGFFASKRNILSDKMVKEIAGKLKDGDIEVLYPSAPEQSLLNYIVIKGELSFCNIARSLSRDQRTGNSVTSSHFKAEGHLLFDRGNRLTYLHYIGVPSNIISRVCSGENLDFPYRDIFLHYRFLKEPEKTPVFKGKPAPYGRTPGFWERKLKQVFRKK